MLSGNKMTLMVELTNLFKGFIDKNIFDEEMILRCWKLANLSDAEIEKQAGKAVVNIIDNMVPELLVRAAAGDNDAMSMLDEIMPNLEKYMEMKKEKGDA